ncbi:MAG: TIGR02281 family clan AA aspartic protease [Kiloniellaceae bacterium]
MSGYQEQATATGGLLRHSLRLAAAVVVTGLVLVFAIDRESPLPGVSASVPDRGTAAPPPAARSELVLQAGPHGHFMVEAFVDGRPLTFLVDTGASSIYLTPEDAATLGWTPPRLTYSERYSTAAGEVRAAPVTLRSLRIGQLELYDLPASVGEQAGSVSLLGMSFLKRLDGYQVRGDRLTLIW